MKLDYTICHSLKGDLELILKVMVITKLVLVHICTSVMCLKCNFFLSLVFIDDRVARLGPLKFVASCSSLLDHQISRRQEYLNARGGDHRLSRTQLG